MLTLNLIILIMLCLILIFWGLSKPERMLQFPALSAWTILLLIVPQFFPLMKTTYRLPYGSLERVIIMTSLCLVMACAGYFMDPRESLPTSIRFKNDRLLFGAFLLVAVGFVASYMLSTLPKEMLSASQWSGLPVRYLFFAHAGKYGFAIALIVFSLTWNKIAFLLILPGIYNAMYTMIFIGRRMPTAIFFLTILCAIWFNKRKIVPRPVMIVGIAIFTLFVFNIGAYRDIMRNEKGTTKEKINDLREMEIISPTEGEKLIDGAAIEMENAANIIEAVDVSGRLDWGAYLYNSIIAAYVPRQLVGSALKNDLMIGTYDYGKLTYDTVGYRLPIGSCGTGIAEAYYSFSYFGCLLFMLMGYIMRRIWEGASAGGIICQLLYIYILAMAISTYSGTIANFVTPWLHFGLFVAPTLWLARDRRTITDEED